MWKFRNRDQRVRVSQVHCVVRSRRFSYACLVVLGSESHVENDVLTLWRTCLYKSVIWLGLLIHPLGIHSLAIHSRGTEYTEHTEHTHTHPDAKGGPISASSVSATCKIFAD